MTEREEQIREDRIGRQFLSLVNDQSSILDGFVLNEGARARKPAGGPREKQLRS